MPRENGQFHNVPMEQYLAWDAVSNSSLGHMLRSPAHFRAELEQPREQTPAMAIGTAVHTSILEPDAFDTGYVCLPDPDPDRHRNANGSLSLKPASTKAYKEECASIALRNPGAVLLGGDEYTAVVSMREAVLTHPVANALLERGGESELSCTWMREDLSPPVMCKGRFDRITSQVDGGAIIDIKKTRDASRHAFERAIFQYGYHRQAAFYLDGAARLGMPVGHFVIIAVEPEPPYAVAVYRIIEGALEAGAAQLDALLAKYAQCSDRDEWPGYPEQVQDIALPSWAWGAVDEQIEEITR